jgi:hypothetical protein
MAPKANRIFQALNYSVYEIEAKGSSFLALKL